MKDSISQPVVAQSSDKFTLYTADALMDFPDAEWLVEDTIEVGSLGVLYGPSKSAKSFTALDIALCISTGRQWNGSEVKKGNTLYIVGEGTRGIKRRVMAWKQAHEIQEIDNAFFLMEAPKVLDVQQVADLSARIKQQTSDLVFIIIDTLATAFVGGDENQSKDMGEFINACRHLQADLGVTLLLVHHTGKGKSTQDVERGSSVLRGAADVMILQRMDKDRVVTIRNIKQKDDEEFPEIRLRLEQVTLGSTTKVGKPVTSCVLVPDGASKPTGTCELAAKPKPDSKPAAVALGVLVEHGELSSPQWRELTAKALNRDVLPPKTYQNWRQSLVEGGFVEAVPGKPPYYRPTAAGSANVLGTLEAAA